jgi:hypothetical protein
MPSLGLVFVELYSPVQDSARSLSSFGFPHHKKLVPYRSERDFTARYSGSAPRGIAPRAS